MGCIYAGSIENLIILRFIQAIGACSATIAATAMVRDLFPPEENAKIFSFLILVLSASPMLAPSIGSWLTIAFGWTSIFLVLTILIIIIFLGVLFFLPESRGADKKYSLHISSVLRNYRSVLAESYFVIYAILGGLGFAGLFAHIASSPGVFIEHFGLTQKQYGLLFAFLASGLIIASQVNNILLKRYKSETLIERSLIFQTSFSMLLLIVSLMHLDNFWVTTSFLFLYLSSVGFIMPNASALSMKPFEQNAGSASALLGFVQMGLGSLATVFVGVFNIKTILPLSVAIMLCSMLGLSIAIARKRLLKRATGSTELGA
jgi:DHA1 family bicyclomycin/chloramphenicol resistance-like MFS transporter